MPGIDRSVVQAGDADFEEGVAAGPGDGDGQVEAGHVAERDDLPGTSAGSSDGHVKLRGGLGAFGEMLVVDGGGEVVAGDDVAPGDGGFDGAEAALQAGDALVAFGDDARTRRTAAATKAAEIGAARNAAKLSRQVSVPSKSKATMGRNGSSGRFAAGGSLCAPSLPILKNLDTGAPGATTADPTGPEVDHRLVIRVRIGECQGQVVPDWPARRGFACLCAGGQSASGLRRRS